MIRFVVWLATATAILVAAMFVFQSWFPFTLPSLFLESTALLIVFTIAIFRLLQQAVNKGSFVQFYFLTIIVKLILYGVYSGWMVWYDPAGAVANVILFMMVYFVFTAIEIAFIYRKIISG